MLLSLFGVITPQDQPIELECNYYLNPLNEYVCQLTGINVPTRETEVVFTGNHQPDMSETDVEVVLIVFANTPFIIPAIYTTFPNIIELNIEFSNLVEIDPIPEHIALQYLIVYFNDVNIIRNDTFATQSNSLVYIETQLNDIETIEDNAYVGTDSVLVLVLRYNQLGNIHPRAFWPMIGVSIIDAGASDVVRIEGDMFSQNSRLTYLNFESNNIREISPRFANGIRESLFIFNIGYNECIDSDFILSEQIVWAFLHNSMLQCYDNFLGRESEGNHTRSITIEFRGSLRLFDEDGNIVFMAN